MSEVMPPVPSQTPDESVPTPVEAAPVSEVPLTPVQPDTRKRRRRYILAMLGVALLCSILLWVSYLTTHQPLGLPVAQVAAKAIQPRYLFSILDVTYPIGLAVSPDGNRVYVGETQGERAILVYDRDGKFLNKFVVPNTNPASSVPVSMDLDPQGRLFVTDSLRRSIDIYNAGGNYQKSIASPFPDGWAPIGVRFDGNNILVTDQSPQNHRVLTLTTAGKLLSTTGHYGEGTGREGFHSPRMAVTDRQGRMYVSDSNNNRVAVFSKAGNFIYDIGGFSAPHGMAIDDDQKLYVVDTIDQSVKVYDVSKNQASPLFSFGDEGSGNGQFEYPEDIAIDGTGRLYITDRANNRVQVWTY
ncbi:MAG: 6-bladed beta-propeller [Anaerolineae bacterium]